jgi:septum site-determining protein MinC
VLHAVGSGAENRSASTARYGGRAVAGVSGNQQARIFFSKIEAELLAIDGFCRTAEDLDASLHGC